MWQETQIKSKLKFCSSQVATGSNDNRVTDMDYQNDQGNGNNDNNNNHNQDELITDSTMPDDTDIRDSSEVVVAVDAEQEANIQTELRSSILTENTPQENTPQEQEKPLQKQENHGHRQSQGLAHPQPSEVGGGAQDDPDVASPPDGQTALVSSVTHSKEPAVGDKMSDTQEPQNPDVSRHASRENFLNTSQIDSGNFEQTKTKPLFLTY